jgi:hypothetical protein
LPIIVFVCGSGVGACLLTVPVKYFHGQSWGSEVPAIGALCLANSLLRRELPFVIATLGILAVLLLPAAARSPRWFGFLHHGWR